MSLADTLAKISLPPAFEPWRLDVPLIGWARSQRSGGGILKVDVYGYESYRVTYLVRDLEVSRVGVVLDDLPAAVAWTLAAVALAEVA